MPSALLASTFAYSLLMLSRIFWFRLKRSGELLETIFFLPLALGIYLGESYLKNSSSSIGLVSEIFLTDGLRSSETIERWLFKLFTVYCFASAFFFKMNSCLLSFLGGDGILIGVAACFLGRAKRRGAAPIRVCNGYLMLISLPSDLCICLKRTASGDLCTPLLMAYLIF